MLFKFIWNEGPDKIKRGKLIQSYHAGGLKMVEIMSFIKGLKISWLKRLYWAGANVTWANIIKEKIPPIEDLVCYGAEKLRDIAKNRVKNAFWSDVISAWADFCAIYHPSPSELLTEKLWFSDHTKFKKSIVRQWNQKGLRFIADLFDRETGLPLSRISLCALFDINMTFLCHASLIRSISVPAESLAEVKNMMSPIIPYKIALLTNNTNLSRLAYKTFVTAIGKQRENQASQENIVRKWRRDIGSINEETFSDVCLVTRNTYLQTFHYRTVSRIIATNTFLYRIGKVESPSCFFCKSRDETLLHLFWECDTVREFLRDVVKYLRDEFQLNINFTAQRWFFPFLAEDTPLYLLITIIAKLVIFKSKQKECHPNIEYFISLLRLEAQKEEQSAIKKNMREVFLRKWGCVSKILITSNSIRGS